MNVIGPTATQTPVLGDEPYELSRYVDTDFHMIMSIIITLTVLYVILLIKLDYNKKWVLY